MAKVEQLVVATGRQFFLDAIGMNVDADSIRVLHATTTPDGRIVASLRLAGGSQEGELSCVLSARDLRKLLRHGLLRPRRAH
jgi:hypothetical protein